MKKLALTLCFSLVISTFLQAQKIVSFTNDGKLYQMLDLTSKEKISWGGYEEIGLPAKSDDNGELNTKAIILAVGNNPGFDGKPYAAKVCDTIIAGGFDDWYLPAKNESEIIYLNIALFNWTESYTLWTSTEAAGTQAVSKYTYNGTYYNVQKVDEYNMVCLRKVE